MASIITLIFLLFLKQIKKVECSESNIENCIESTTSIYGEEICVKCEDKYFPLFNDFYCFPCDDRIYGQLGCGGNCDSSNYKENRIAFCNPQECRDGYEYVNGMCFNCTIEQPGCKICNSSETIVDGQKAYSYVCSECLSNEYLLDTETNMCKKCHMDNCINCHYNDFFEKECDNCENTYYLTSNRTC